VSALPDRFCTVFVYLNDVAEGGRTTFVNLHNNDIATVVAANVDAVRTGATHSRASKSQARSLSIVPRSGMAVVHFPTTTSEYLSWTDPNTDHESEDAVLPK
jgi:hypothetical protein